MVNFRTATVKDLNKIVQMLADDELGRIRERYETPLPESYLNLLKQLTQTQTMN